MDITSRKATESDIIACVDKIVDDELSKTRK